MTEHKRPCLQHYIIEIFDLDRDSLASTSSLQSYAYDLADQARLHFVSKIAYDFNPSGASFIFILSASHLAMHSWPEDNYLHIDLLLCEELPQGLNLDQLIRQVFKTREYIILKVNYGDLPLLALGH